MSYFIFLKNSENISNNLYKIAKDQTYLNYLNLGNLDNYTIIQDTEENFNLVRLGIKGVKTYANNQIIYYDLSYNFGNKKTAEINLNNIKENIILFLKNNTNSPIFQMWNDYYNQLSNFNLDTINYPLSISFEQYFENNGLISLNPLQLP